MNVYKITYEDQKTGNTWRASILAESRQDAESFLREKVSFIPNITNFEDVGKLDAISTKCLNLLTETKKKGPSKKKDKKS